MKSCNKAGVTAVLDHHGSAAPPAPSARRILVASLVLGGILGGALAPILAQALAERGGLMLVGLYLAGAALVSLLSLLWIGPD